MRIFLFLLCLCSFVSCSNDPDPKKMGKDSIGDSLRDTTSTNHSTYDSCAVLKREIPADTAQQQLSIDLIDLHNCSVDSFDLLYVVPNLLPNFVIEERLKNNTHPTYQDFLNYLNEFRHTDSYLQLQINVLTLDSLQALPYEPKKLQQLKPSFGRLGMTGPEWEAFSAFVRDWKPANKKNTTWRDAFNAFEKAMQ